MVILNIILLDIFYRLNYQYRYFTDFSNPEKEGEKNSLILANSRQ
jgi:hypothetical protein